MTSTRPPAFAALVAALVLAACGDDPAETAATDTAATDITVARTGELEEPVIDPGDGGDYAPAIDPADFTDIVDNPYMPLAPGSRWVYEERSSDGEVTDVVVEVLDERRTVMGVSTIVVHDVASVGGEVVEDTYDWFAQDSAGNVWYFGEDTTSYDSDGTSSTKGAWEAGVGDAFPGIAMPAEPAVTGTGYRQEYLAGTAEDMGEVLAVSGSASTPFGDFDDVIVTRDWTPLEPDVVEEKTYARGVGVVSETTSDGDTAALVEFIAGS
jgi:hypothetical protein